MNSYFCCFLFLVNNEISCNHLIEFILSLQGRNEFIVWHGCVRELQVPITNCLLVNSSRTAAFSIGFLIGTRCQRRRESQNGEMQYWLKYSMSDRRTITLQSGTVKSFLMNKLGSGLQLLLCYPSLPLLRGRCAFLISLSMLPGLHLLMPDRSACFLLGWNLLSLAALTVSVFPK